MSTTHFRLEDHAIIHALVDWHSTAHVGDVAVVALPFQACRLRLIRGHDDQLRWALEGGRR
jgi:hypothetical protein